MAAFFRQVSWGKVDGDAFQRQRQPGSDQSGTHALPRLGDRFIGQADDGETDISGRNLHLNIDRTRLNPVGKGMDQPIASNADEAGRAQNRRVELVRQ